VDFDGLLVITAAQYSRGFLVVQMSQQALLHFINELAPSGLRNDQSRDSILHRF
jgi:hypothetical protein